MDAAIPPSISKGDPLPLASLRLLVPPLQLLSASMMQVLKNGDALNYWKVAEFVSLVTDMVPELLMHKHRSQLVLGLRSRYIVELCRGEELERPDFILSRLDKIKVTSSEEEEIVLNFLGLIQTLLKDPEERRDFFSEVFPGEYGALYDNDLQTLFSEFLYRLTQLLPVPDFEQTVSWLGADCSVFEEFEHSVSKPTDLNILLRHHKHLGHLEQHVPPSSMGDRILSSLSVVFPKRESVPAEQAIQTDPLPGLSDDTETVTFMEDVAVEIITVTDYAEIELTASTNIEVVMGENCFKETVSSLVAEDSLVVLPDETARVGEVDAGEDEKAVGGFTEVVSPEVHKDNLETAQHKINAGPHDCPDCKKKFKFASSLIAHRVIHTGERPHRCSDCGRCFSFRQSLDRHRHRHKAANKYQCVICGEAFDSLSACTQHKQTHMVDDVYTCHQCEKRFNWEMTLARHLKSHSNDHSANKPSEIQVEEQQVVSHDKVVGEAPAESDGQIPADDQTDYGKGYAKAQSSQDPSFVQENSFPVPDSEVMVAKVRTSGRKRKPTMKIQVINLQKSLTTKKKRTTKTKSLELKPLPVNSKEEHSYGSIGVSSTEDEKSGSIEAGSSAAFSCPKCSFKHSEEVQVQLHIDKVHSVEAEDDKESLQPPTDEEGRFSCPDCEKSFKFKSLLTAHQRIHTGEQPFPCPQCGRRFSFKQSLERHKQTHKSGRKYECLICGEFFKTLMAQKEHRSTHMENGEYMCSECGRAFAWKSALVRHLKTHSEEVNKVERSFKCPRCELSFSCASYLNRHLQTHQEERVHTCNCGKSFAYRAALTAHQRIHQKERPHMCTQCGKGFLYKGGLLSHMKIHSEEMPFMCSFCGKSFKRERNMKKHERCHTRENVFSCSQCDKSFVYKATLIRHELTHSGERPYLCSDCGKGFFSHAELLKHERFHSGHKPFQCPHCGKSFTQSCYLTIHLRYHTGVRPYSCTECDKSFLSANRLKRHQRTHSGEKPYLCIECGKGFRQSYNLKMHQRTHTIKLA